MTINTRIAPSPTGNLHLGTVRTALYNILLAKHSNGNFYFRLEDTDRERSKEEFTQEIINGFQWLGLTWDAVPSLANENGMVRQSLQNSTHAGFVDQLIQSKKAYKCYASAEELTILRESQEAAKKAVGYDNRGRHLSPEEIARYEAEGRSWVIRLNLGADRDIRWEDVVRGSMSINTKDLGGDPVIQKQNGQILYNFAVVIDDHEMNITHVFRGEDHLTNTAKQIVIYEALDFPVPIFGHLPLIFTQDKQKLSKRKHGDIAGVEKYRQEGYLPEALLNYLIAMSYTCPQHPEREVYSLEEAIRDFDPRGLSKSPAIYDLNKLNWFNREYMLAWSLEELILELKKYSQYDLESIGIDKLKLLVDNIRGNLNKFSDIDAVVGYFFVDFVLDDKQRDLLASVANVNLLTRLKEELSRVEFENAEDLKNLINNIGDELNLHGKNLYLPIRIALSGRTQGPDLGLILYVLGKTQSLARL